MLRSLLLFCCFLLPAPLLAAALPPVQQLDADATAAYRAGDYEAAAAAWSHLLEEAAAELAGPERARLCYNLGNAHGRMEEWELAVGWYTAALRLAPRDGDSWANLEHARLEAGLDPADRGDLSSTLRRILGALTRAEARWLALLGLLPLAACLLLEALRGGRLWRVLALLALPLWLLSLLPLAWGAWTHAEQPALIIKSTGVDLRSEPRFSAAKISRAEAGALVEHTDELPGWTKVRLPGGREGWIRAGASFLLDR